MCFYTQTFTKSVPQYRHLDKIDPPTCESDNAIGACSVNTFISNIKNKPNKPKTITFSYSSW